MYNCLKINTILFITFMVFTSCFNPFFPPTDSPPASNSLRSTPQGIINQLVDAYQKRDYYLYRDLFSESQDFRFYVYPGFSSEKDKLVQTCEKVDSMCAYILSKGLTCLKYWTYSDEMLSHTKLLNPDNVEKIQLSFSSLDPGDIRFIINGNHETTNVEVIMRNGTLNVDTKAFVGDDGNSYQDHYYVDDIGEQVLYLEKDPKNPALWVILKWFDLKAIQ
jgi:hypothetical protein